MFVVFVLSDDFMNLVITWPQQSHNTFEYDLK